jgi:hypothetical protein
MSDVEGRLTDALRTSRGLVTETTVQKILCSLDLVYRCRIIQEADDVFRALVILDGAREGDLADRLEKRLLDELGPDARIVVEPVSRIDTEPSGKYRLVQTRLRNEV